MILYGMLMDMHRGYRDFYSRDTISLTQKVANGIHKLGGTIIETSQGGYDNKKIINCFEDRGINQVRYLDKKNLEFLVKTSKLYRLYYGLIFVIYL